MASTASNTTAQQVFGERYEHRIARAIAYIEERLHEPMTLSGLAAIACLSPFHFHRVFRTLTGESVRSFVERRKLERAVGLARKGHSWKSASAASGFRSPVSFTRAFKRVYGTTPTTFDLEGWWAARGDREAAGAISAFFLRPPPPLDPDFAVELRERPAARLAVARVWGGYLAPDRLVAAYQRLRDWADAAGIATGGGRIAGASRDDPDLTPLSRCRYDFMIELPCDVVPPPRFALAERAAGLWAITQVQGDLAAVDRAWSMLFKSWLPASGLDLRDAPVEEVYRRLPEDIGWSAFDLECCVPVAIPERG
ncbi:AraC family transcriptional regulator [Parerythrobacter lacustris]|uniref:AraC family transcriptional regulator n=1 Tax=Parerythrobacter lacustris TaxID=2969984 RepID=A0ABT1XPR0_9SPHN|nr:AraC family transcriptional regulator [Parerythrobacter lacustris]